MKKPLQIAVAVGLALFVASCKTTKPSGGRGGGTAEVENVFVYSFEAPSKATSAASKTMISKLLGATVGEDLYKSDENIEYYVSDKDVNETFEHDLRTGNFTFRKSMQKYEGDFAPKLPSKEEAIAVAQAFLGEHGLTPKNQGEMTLAHYGGLRAASVIDGRRAGPVIDKMITISYSRTVDNLPVLGPGSKVVVNVGDQGEITGLVYRWRELAANKRKSVRAEEINSQKEAEQLAKRQIMQEFGEGSTYKILSSGRAYYDNNGKVLQPVYVFETEITINSPDRNLQPVRYLCIIPMLKRSPEPLNLTTLDPAAKRAIKSGKLGAKTPGHEGEAKPVD